MRIIHEHAYESVQERSEYTSKIHQNIVTTLYSVDHAMTMLGLQYHQPRRWTRVVEDVLKPCTNCRYVMSWKKQFLEQLRCIDGEDDDANVQEDELSQYHHIEGFDPCCITSLHIMCLQSYQSIVQLGEPLVQNQLEVIQSFWNDEGVQQCLKRRNEFNLMDSSAYYMARIDEILAESYVPTVQDILRVRIPTNGKWVEIGNGIRNNKTTLKRKEKKKSLSSLF